MKKIEKIKNNMNGEKNNNTNIYPSNNIIEEAKEYFINRRIRFHKTIET